MMETPANVETDITTFIAVWDERLGPKVVDLVPATNASQISSMAIQIFMTFETVFGNSADVQFNRTLLTLPLKTLQVNARLLFDTIESEDVRGGRLPFIVVVLVPERFPDKQLPVFDDVLEKLSTLYARSQGKMLEAHYDKVRGLFETEMTAETGAVSIDESYSFTAAVQDFQRGIQLFQARKLRPSFPYLKRALLKFNQEANTKLQMEATFLLATILMKQRKYELALEYYGALAQLAIDLQHQKYLEQARFMSGFAYYKTNQLGAALDQLNLLNPAKTQHVNPFRYAVIKAQVLAALELTEEAIAAYQHAFDLSTQLPHSEATLRQRAQVLYELGLQHYKHGTGLAKKGLQAHASEIRVAIQKAIDYFTGSADVWRELGEFTHLVTTYKLIGNTHAILGDKEHQLSAFKDALEVATRAGEFASRVPLMNRIIQIQESLELHEQNVADIQAFLEELSDSSFVDMIVLANLYLLMGQALLALEKPEEAIASFLRALNLYKQLASPVDEQRVVLEHLVDAYRSQGQTDRAEYYAHQLEKLKEAQPVSETPRDQRLHPLGAVKEIWVYTDSGMELFSYAPETRFDPDLLGGFLSAMQSFSLELRQEKLHGLVIGNDRYIIYREPDRAFYILGRAGLRAPESSIHRVLQQVYARFYEEFGEALDDSVVDMSGFARFGEVLEKIDLSAL